MSVRRVVLCACFGVGLVVAAGCKSSSKDEKPGTSVVTSAAIRDEVDGASQRVATARCQKEVSCAGPTAANRQGWNAEANMEACVARVKLETGKEVSQEACPRGIDQDRLIRCVAAIEKAGCDDPVGRLMQIEDCKRSKVCVSSSAP